MVHRQRLEQTEPRLFRRLLVAAGSFYLAWWFVVEAVLPGSFNPLASRLAVVATFYASFALTASRAARRERRASWLFSGCTFLATAHFFYLFLGNHGTEAWVLGTYVIVMAVSVCFRSRATLMVYSAFVLALAAACCAADRALLRTIFLPGLVTIVALSSAGLLSRLALLDRLAESTRRFEGLFNATFEGIAVHDRGRILDANDALASLLGYERSALLGRRVDQLVEPLPGRTAGAAGASPAPGAAVEAVGVQDDGTRIPVEVVEKDYRDDQRGLRVLAVRDLRERKRAEDERIQLGRAQAGQAAAEAAVRVRDEFISIASHELRTPLTPLRLQIQTLQRALRGGGADPVPRERLERALALSWRQTERLNRLVDELLDASRFSTGKLSLEPAPLALTELVREVVEALAADIAAAEVTVQISGDEGAVGTWDALRIEQIITNLLRNALIYGRGKPVHITVKATGDRVVLAVSDQGIGIGAADRERVFGRFERAAPAANYGGLGLGLYIVKQIVDAHGGSIRLESALSEGSTFTVELPRGAAAPAWPGPLAAPS